MNETSGMKRVSELEWPEPQLNEEQAKAFHDSDIWKSWTDRQIAEFQFYQRLLCIPFSRFHEATGKALGRPVWTHEFAFLDGLRKELMGEKPAPSMTEILNLIPAEKRIVLTVPE